MKNLLRQIKDIQVQGDRICSSRVSMIDIQEFGRFTNELKSHLENKVIDEFVLKLVSEIPNLKNDLKKKDVAANLAEGIIALMGNGISLWGKEKRQVDRAKNVVREIQGKFSSIEFVLKNVQG